jgi:hypothetical protein
MPGEVAGHSQNFFFSNGQYIPDAFNNSQNAMKDCQTVFSRFLLTTIFVPAENIQHSGFPGHIPFSVL